MSVLSDLIVNTNPVPDVDALEKEKGKEKELLIPTYIPTIEETVTASGAHRQGCTGFVSC
ncbi:hypothetical protein [Streptomyces kanamyceticus]|uniref:Uncharacterized protein n=1 Tax=Streptomyces kanamyceticus TaxID=1967 RepID=A0A5J6G7L7_STRKN|nr:hypothetical protein [Streptomyces kanamyceticus]QEU90947.1 hypothetical protein CP970_08675 [Streptomyces kanamyceticus]